MHPRHTLGRRRVVQAMYEMAQLSRLPLWDQQFEHLPQLRQHAGIPAGPHDGADAVPRGQMGDPLMVIVQRPALEARALDHRHAHLQHLLHRARRRLGGHAHECGVDGDQIARMRHHGRTSCTPARCGAQGPGAAHHTGQGEVRRLLQRRGTGLAEPAPADDRQAQRLHSSSRCGGHDPSAGSPVSGSIHSAKPISRSAS